MAKRCGNCLPPSLQYVKHNNGNIERNVNDVTACAGLATATNVLYVTYFQLP